MNLNKARKLRDFLRSHRIPCTVPLGNGPDGYFVSVPKWDRRFSTIAEYNAFAQKNIDSLQAWMRQNGFLSSGPRSPIERMIDEACITPKDLDTSPGDCSGCTDPRSEGTHQMGTIQHPLERKAP